MNFYPKNRFIKRDHLLFILIVMAMLAVLARAFYVQIIESNFLQSEGNKRQIRHIKIPAPRGEIYDRNGVVLALSTPIASVWCDPKQLIPYLKLNRAIEQGNSQLLKGHSKKDLLRVRHQLNQYKAMTALLELSKNTLTQKIFSHSKYRFMYLKRFITPELGQKIAHLGLPGVYVEPEYKRYYPAGETTAHLVGFTDSDGVGIAGIEKTYNDWLTGKAGKKVVIKDRAGHVVDFVKDVTVARPGKPIYLSIDADLQFFLERALKRVMIQQEPIGASSVILDAQTGEVLAMVNLPAFNPNDRTQLKGGAIRDRALEDVFEPGSTIKPLVMAKALSDGVVHLGEKINTSPGAITIQGRRLTDTKNKGILTLTGIIQHSSNVGMAKISLRMKAKPLWTFFNDLGFGEQLGTFLPGESQGLLRPYETWQKVEKASMSFGYGLNVNLLQLARAYTIFSQNGQLLPITFLKKQPEKHNVSDEGEVKKQIVSPAAAQAVLAMMEKVVSKQGTAPEAMISGYRVAGKTGTAHISIRGGYEENQYHSLFVGLVPASHPKFIMATMVDHPSRGVYYGGLVAGPVFKEVMSQALRLYNIPTDQIKQVNLPVVKPSKKAVAQSSASSHLVKPVEQVSHEKP